MNSEEHRRAGRREWSALAVLVLLLLLIGAAGFSVASVAAAYAPNAEALIAARAVLGIAGATLMPSTLALIRNIFVHDADRTKAMAVWAGVMSSGVAIGPVLSGALLQYFWRGSVFLINIPAMALLLVLAPALLPEFRGARAERFDWISAGLSLAAGRLHSADMNGLIPSTGAVGVSAGLPGGDAVLSAARAAFTSGMNTMAILGAIVMVVAALGCGLLLRTDRPAAEPSPADDALV
ncbi:MFS transporter [Nocardia sp. NPDC051981]|uniref:MFS transporter n=1 Tax=Nocardia sp. NPDC051981 TaxID=3155417 RepID=UPI003439175C